ncbi:oligosaccharide flippase family protein [Paraburkholderia sp. RP-4-7]|uniref:Oligosaccharide flippase family protein n=1 Tax=Paraburkholderia polaris TaxID=2728848 RepID=A0A848I9L0_9BURK|nr:oligosaccharide flippase family protein [Paraburkholderia polaris]NML96698.1 oligosaccharide flippase family protein [Paraburkholderia polaris]
MEIRLSSIVKKGSVQLVSSLLMAALQLLQIGVISRSFAAAPLGIVSINLMIVAVATVFSDFGLQSFVIQDKRDMKFTLLDVRAVLPIFISATVMISLVGACLARYCFGALDVGNALLWIAPAMPLTVISGPVQGAAVRELHIERLAFAEFAGKACGVATTVFLASSEHAVVSVIAGFYVSQVVRLLFLHETVLALLIAPRGQKCSAGRRGAVVSYAVAQMLGQVSNTLAAKADELIVAAAMPLETFGIYSSMKQLVIQAVAFVAPVVRRLTMPFFANHRGGIAGKSRFTPNKLICWSNAVYIGFFVSVALTSEPSTRFIFGSRFIIHADWLILFALLWSVRTFAGGGISAFLQSTGAPLTDFWWTLVQLIVQTTVMLMAAPNGVYVMLISAIVSYLIVGVLGYLTIYRRKSGASVSEVVTMIIIPAFLYYIFGLSLLWLESVFEIYWVDALCAFIFMCAVIAATIIISGDRRILFQRSAV